VFKKRTKSARHMSTDTGGSAISRRRLFGTGAAMGVGMAAGANMGGTGTAQAAQGDPVLLGKDVAGATHRTALFSTTGEVAVLNDPGNDGGAPGSVGVWGIGNKYGVYGNANANSNGDGVAGFGDGSGTGVAGIGGSSGGYGVVGNGGTNKAGVYGIGNGSGEGVVGVGNNYGVSGAGNTAGVQGSANLNSGGTGVQGQGDGTGAGVTGVGGGSGAGVTGIGGQTNGMGLYGNGYGGGGGVVGVANGSAPGVAAYSHNGEGIYARSGQSDGTIPGRNGVHGVTDSPTAAGVCGEALGGGNGVLGSTTSGSDGGVQGVNHGTGPAVIGQSAGGTGVTGSGGVNGVGVSGTGNGTGPGVLANNTGSGPALSVIGPAAFNRSGVLTIAANKSSATLSGISLGAASLVLVTIQGNVAGIYVQGVTVVSGSSGSFTVHLNKATTKALNVGWFVVN
jgi:hypothetical protein